MPQLIELAPPRLEFKTFEEFGQLVEIVFFVRELLGRHLERHVALDRQEFPCLRQPVDHLT